MSGLTNLTTTPPRRIGRACAIELWGEGASLALTYNRNKAAVDELVQLLTKDGSHTAQKISTHQVDMASADGLTSMMANVEEQHGRTPDILIPNAGYGKRIPMINDIPLDEFDYTLTVNLRSAFILAKGCIPGMTERKWGRIVFISSISGQGGGINGCHYAASKAGMTGMMKNLARKHAADGITVNDVAPAMIGDTGMIPDAKYVAGTPGDVKNIPVGRLGTPQEVANVVMMLCKTGYMTGQSILLSGGLQ